MFSLLLHFAQKFILANSCDPEGTQHYAASEMGLHCYFMSTKWVSSLQRVNWISSEAVFIKKYRNLCAYYSF